MSVAGISSSNLFDFNTQSVQNRKQQFQQEFQQLGQDLQSGNLSAAQTDFATIQQSGPQISSIFVESEHEPHRTGFQTAVAGHPVWRHFGRAAGLREDPAGFPESVRWETRSPSSSGWWRWRSQRDQPVDAGVGTRPADWQPLGRPAGLQHVAAGLPAVCTEQRAVRFIGTVQSKWRLRKRLSRPFNAGSGGNVHRDLRKNTKARTGNFQFWLSFFDFCGLNPDGRERPSSIT